MSMMNTEPRYTVLLSSAGAIVGKEWPSYRRNAPPLTGLPNLPRTSAAWVDHSVDAAGHLLRVEREKPTFAVRVASLPGGVEETGDGTPEHPFVNLDSLRQRFDRCLIHAMNCAGITLSVSVTGTVDYETHLPCGSSGDSVFYDFSQAEVGGSALIDAESMYGVCVVRDLRAPYSVFGSGSWNMIYNNCSWGGPPPVSRRFMMRDAGSCAFDRCSFSAEEQDRSFFGGLYGVTVAGGTFHTSGAPVFYEAHGCVFSGVSAVRDGSVYSLNYGLGGGLSSRFGAIVSARNSIFESCSVSHTCHLVYDENDIASGNRVANLRYAAVSSCGGCTFDRCSAAVAVAGGDGGGYLCLQACAFYRNSGSVFHECTGNALREGACPASGPLYDSGYGHPMPCEP